MTSKFTRRDKSLPITKPIRKPIAKSIAKTKKKNGNGTLVLTHNEKIFADEWLIDRNGTRAYRTAYPNIKNVKAFTLLRKVKIDRYVTKALAKLSATSRLDTEWVLKRYEMLADYCISDFFNDDGSMKPFSEIPKEKLYAIGGFKQEKKTITTKDKRHITNCIKEFKLPDKRANIDSVARYLKLFGDESKDKGGITADTINIQINLVSDGEVVG